MVKRVHAAAVGSLAGLSATALMTEVMNRLYRRLPSSERYPLPPRELTERCWPGTGRLDEEQLRTRSLIAHFGYGAFAGAFLASTSRRPSVARGVLFGVLVWAASYLAWAPLTGRLRSAMRHPPRRNALMILAHLAWGGATVLAYRSLEDARGRMLAGGPIADGPTERRHVS